MLMYKKYFFHWSESLRTLMFFYFICTVSMFISKISWSCDHLPAVASLHQLTQLVLSGSELFQTLLVAQVCRAGPLQQRHLGGQLAGPIPKPLD